MESEDIEQLIENARYKHLSEVTLVSYRDNQLNKVRVAMADAHLRLCLLCDRRLAYLREEAKAVEGHVLTDEARSAIQRTMEKISAERKTSIPGPTLIQKLSDYFIQLSEAWIMLFAKEATLGTDDGDEIWRYESEDGVLTARATLASDASLKVQLSSTELAWEGVRFRFRLGPFTEEVTLHRDGDSVVAEINIPRRERARNMADFAIDVL